MYGSSIQRNPLNIIAPIILVPLLLAIAIPSLPFGIIGECVINPANEKTKKNKDLGL